MTLPRIAICVVTYNSAPLIEELTDSLRVGTEDTDWVLIFADNASSDNTVAEISRCAPEATLIETGANIGYSGGLNAAASAAGDVDAYLILNADVRLTPGCVRTLFDTLSPSVGIAVPRLVDGDGALIWSMRREPTLGRAWADALVGAERAGTIGTLGEIVTDPRLYTSARPTDWAEGSTQLISAACWSANGSWDESYFLYSEETDYDLRAGDAGFITMYQPAAVAQHLEGGSAASPQLWSLLVANRVRLYRQRHGNVAGALFWLATAVREGTRALLGKETSRAAVRDLVSPKRMAQPRGPEWLAAVRR